MRESSGPSPRTCASSVARRISGWRSAIAFGLALLTTACSEPAADDQYSELPPAIVDRITRPGEGGAVHLVRIIQRGEIYEFQPNRIAIPSGDVVRFVHAGIQPESIAFDTIAATPKAAADFIRSRSLHFGVLLVEPGQAYDVSFVDAPPGVYPFVSRPHAERGMRGVVVVGGGEGQHQP